MPGRKLNARDTIVEVETDVADTFVAIEPDGILGIVVNRGENEEVAATTTYGSQGEYEQEVMQRGATMAITGFELRDETTGELDPGQARMETLGTLKGASSVGRIRFRNSVSTNWVIWSCTVTLGEGGGEINAKSSWAVTVTKSGPSTTEVVVVVP